MSNKSPLAVVTEQFGGKDKLVDKLVGLLSSTGDEPKDELRTRLLGAANKKLLRLHRVASTLKEQYGSRDELIQKVATGAGRTKDKDFVTRLESYTTPRLVDIAQVAARKARKAARAKPA